MLRSGVWFAIVGVAAAFTHFIIFALARHITWPEAANAVGFIVAFWVSFFGHRKLSFTDTSTTAKQSLWRFALTALAGFIGNEIFFVLGYRMLHWSAFLAWFVATLLAAGQTFVLSRLWAFRR
jgi:putative flippase GtrA